MKKTILLTTALMASVALTGCGANGGSTDGYEAHPYDAPPISESVKIEYLRAVNNARSAGRTCGQYGFFPATTPLTWDNNLYTTAYEHTQDMAEENFFSHNGSGGNSDWTYNVQELNTASTFSDRAINNNAKYADSENIGAGIAGVDAIVNAWIKSPAHCSSLMDNTARFLGMAKVENGNSEYKVYWTQILGG